MDEDKVPEPPENVLLRDRLAMSALQATTGWMAERTDTYPEMARRCYVLADAMLKARERSE